MCACVVTVCGCVQIENLKITKKKIDLIDLFVCLFLSVARGELGLRKVPVVC